MSKLIFVLCVALKFTLGKNVEYSNASFYLAIRAIVSRFRGN